MRESERVSKRERKTAGSLRNIKKGGIEEECFSGERKGEEAGIHFFIYII